MQQFSFIGILLIYLNLLCMFRATNSPIFRGSFDCIYSFRYTAPILLPTGDKATHFHLNLVTGR